MAIDGHCLIVNLVNSETTNSAVWGMENSDVNSEPVTRLLQGAGSSELISAELFPLVYDELRKLAAAQLAGERAEQTLQPTALVHEAYLRLVGDVDLK